MGNAEEFAETLNKEAIEKLHLKSKVINVSEIKDTKIFNENSLIVIIASTWGEGEPTDDCIEFNEMVKSKKFWDEFNNKENLNMAFFGLGNVIYTHFNAQIKLFHKIFVEEHGLNEICEMGLGNAKDDIEQDFENWKNKIFFKKLYEFYKNKYEKNYDFYKKYGLLNEIEGEKKENLNDIKNNNYEINYVSDKKELNNIDNKNYNQNIQNHLNSKKVRIDNIEELRQNTINGSTLKVSLNLKNTNIKYNPADSILIYPQNKEESVNKIMNHLEIKDSNQILNYKIINNSLENLNLPIPSGITIYEALKEYIDLSCHINEAILQKLIMYISDKNQKQKLSEIINDEKKLSLFLSNNYNIIDFIQEYNSLKITLPELIQILPSIIPRYYTCSSSFNKNQELLEIIITLVKLKGPSEEKRYGLTSNFFNDLFTSKLFTKKDCYVNMIVKESVFKIPKEVSIPMIMVCTGSGIAPFISFLNEFDIMKKNNEKLIFETYLIFGSMNKKNDFLFENELNNYKKSGILKDYYTAFSRDQEKKIYVQDVLEINFDKEKIDNLLIKKKGILYICGSTSMGNEVINKIKGLLGDNNFDIIKKNGQLIIETWQNKK